MSDKDDFIREAKSKLGISEKAAQGLWDLGIHEICQLKGKNPIAMYEELRSKSGSFCEPCMLNQFKLAVKLANGL